MKKNLNAALNDARNLEAQVGLVVNEATSSFATKVSSLIVRGKDFFRVENIRKWMDDDMEVIHLRVSLKDGGDVVSIVVRENDFSFVDGGDITTTWSRRFNTASELLEYISNKGKTIIDRKDITSNGSVFGMGFAALIKGQYVKIMGTKFGPELHIGDEVIIPVDEFYGISPEVGIKINGIWYTPSHNIYFYKEGGEWKQASIC